MDASFTPSFLPSDSDSDFGYEIHWSMYKALAVAAKFKSDILSEGERKWKNLFTESFILICSSIFFIFSFFCIFDVTRALSILPQCWMDFHTNVLIIEANSIISSDHFPIWLPERKMLKITKFISCINLRMIQTVIKIFRQSTDGRIEEDSKCIFSRQGMHVASVFSIQMRWYLSPELFWQCAWLFVIRYTRCSLQIQGHLTASLATVL